MLKDIFEKQFKNKNAIDKILGSLIDGYVDVKMYRDTENGKQLVYHDTGDNVVTDWMRHAILMMLVGKSVMKNGNNLTIGNDKTKPAGNSSNDNPNGYILNGEQYNWSIDSLKGGTNNDYFALYPTKILLGTKKEYTSWDELVADNSSNQEYLTELISIYSDGDDEESAQTNFNDAVNNAAYDNYYSATIGSQGYYIDNNTNNNLAPTVTVNDSNISGGIPVAETNMHKQFGVVGAVKTIITSQNDDNLAESLDENNNKLVKGPVRGTGKPCFIYFNREKDENDWAQQNAAEIFLTADNNSRILNRITFKITMPAQTASNGNLGKYYPYNGYTLKQIGLFNDAYMTKDGETPSLKEQMPSGMLLAVKNIEAFTKTAEETVALTWTLTI